MSRIGNIYRFTGKGFGFLCSVAAAYSNNLLLEAIFNCECQLEKHLPVHPARWLCEMLMPELVIDGETGLDILMLDAVILCTLVLLPLWYFLWKKSVFWTFLLLWGLSLGICLFTVGI